MVKIFYVCGDWDHVAGGVNVIYRNVALLREAGHDARVLHFKSGFRYPWANTVVPVQYIETLPGEALRDAVLVIPEVFGPRLHQRLELNGVALDVSQVPKLIFNQNHAMTFLGWGYRNQDAHPYTAPGLLGAITVSRHDRDYLRLLFPDLRVFVKRNTVDPALFHPEPKENIVTMLVRKNQMECENVVNGLFQRGALAGFRLALIKESKQEEFARMLRRSSLFLSFGYPESFGLPAAEALACGCTVVGYNGFGGAEFFDLPAAHAVPEGNVLAFIRTAETVLTAYRSDPAGFQARGVESSQAILDRYSPAGERQDLLDIWRTVLNG